MRIKHDFNYSKLLPATLKTFYSHIKEKKNIESLMESSINIDNWEMELISAAKKFFDWDINYKKDGGGI